MAISSLTPSCSNMNIVFRRFGFTFLLDWLAAAPRIRFSFRFQATILITRLRYLYSFGVRLALLQRRWSRFITSWWSCFSTRTQIINEVWHFYSTKVCDYEFLQKMRSYDALPFTVISNKKENLIIFNGRYCFIGLNFKIGNHCSSWINIVIVRNKSKNK